VPNIARVFAMKEDILEVFFLELGTLQHGLEIIFREACCMLASSVQHIQAIQLTLLDCKLTCAIVKAGSACFIRYGD
jgi:hypothetical protein